MIRSNGAVRWLRWGWIGLCGGVGGVAILLAGSAVPFFLLDCRRGGSVSDAIAPLCGAQLWNAVWFWIGGLSVCVLVAATLFAVGAALKAIVAARTSLDRYWAVVLLVAAIFIVIVLGWWTLHLVSTEANLAVFALYASLSGGIVVACTLLVAAVVRGVWSLFGHTPTPGP